MPHTNGEHGTINQVMRLFLSIPLAFISFCGQREGTSCGTPPAAATGHSSPTQ